MIRLLEDLSGFRPPNGSALTIGVFDGVHRGHQHLLHRLDDLAAERALTSCVITFMNHPRTVLVPWARHSYIITIDERIALLRQTGVHRVIPLSFTHELSQLTYREFTEALVEQLRLRLLLIGPDFAMGKGRQGTGPELNELGKEMGFEVIVAEPLLLDGEVVSTTAARLRLETGDVHRTRLLLGRYHGLSGVVVSGEARGRLLGFPTANLQILPDILVPLNGIYATIAVIDGQERPSVTSIGVQPTFGTGQRTLETFIMDFSGDLYGKSMTIRLVQRIREERKFPDVPSLVTQINADVAAARAILAKP